MKCCYFLDGVDASILRSASLILTRWLSEPRSVEPSLQDLGVMLQWTPLVLRSFVDRNTMACHYSHRWRQTDKSEIDLVNADGQAAVLVEKTRNTKKVHRRDAS